jgi:hypothetical protein
VRARADAGRTRDREADVAVTFELRLTGVDSHPYADMRAVGPVVLG